MSVRVSTLADCSACGARIFWARTPYGKRQPIDAAPHDDGNIIIVRHPTEHDTIIAVALGKLDDKKRQGLRRMGLQLRTAHHMTCPNADEFRRS